MYVNKNLVSKWYCMTTLPIFKHQVIRTAGLLFHSTAYIQSTEERLLF